MAGTAGAALFGIVLLSACPVVDAADTTGLIIAGTVAGVVLLLLCAGVAIVCFYKRQSLNEQEDKHRHRKNKHKVFVANGVPPPHKHYAKRHHANGFIHNSAPQMPPPPMMTSVPMPRPPPPAYVESVPAPPLRVPYATYHGPPPEMRYQMQGQSRPGTMSGPPPIVIPFETTGGAGGTVTVRPDPRPVVHKRSKYKRRERIDTNDEHRRSPSKHRSPSRHRHKSQEFIVQQSYDGIPVIRPVIYIDDDEEDRHRHRSKSRDRHHKKNTPSPKEGAQITEISDEPQVTIIRAEAEVNTDQTSQSRILTPPPTQTERSRASSVTEAVNALRMSVKDHLDDDNVSTSSHSSKAPSFGWTQSEQRAPDPVAGDVIFYPAGTQVETSRHTEPHAIQKEDVYSYTKVIRSSAKASEPLPPESPIPAREPTSHSNEGYEVPKDIRRSATGTRDEEKHYQTEHDPVIGPYSDIGTSMSDRLQHLVEDGDKSRFSHYNVGAINFAEEEGDEEPVQMRVKRPDTPPSDIPRESFYSKVIKRPKSPPNDIPIVSPRESTEVPPLNLTSTVNSPREQSYRPSTPPKDFPITPQSSFIRPRPSTPPTDFPMTPKDSGVSARPATPPYDGLDTSRVGETQRSTAVDPTTGEPGSFQARQRLIEAHLMKNAQPGPSGSGATAKPAQSSVPKPAFTPAPQPPPVPVVTVTPGVVPPAPPPPPLPR
ncbi:cell surface glycoprotein 1-like [Mercenaria mercenaria]|uniref:cell surface glycoprotein 1-like n=1 Tax=Mercenaria mercenaria TaxID=6596 RepID=UPI00234F514E|nr:cell surface glycoprotein 1-like [Mercenaria mercenaria]